MLAQSSAQRWVGDTSSSMQAGLGCEPLLRRAAAAPSQPPSRGLSAALCPANGAVRANLGRRMDPALFVDDPIRGADDPATSAELEQSQAAADPPLRKRSPVAGNSAPGTPHLAICQGTGRLGETFSSRHEKLVISSTGQCLVRNPMRSEATADFRFAQIDCL